MKLIKFLIWVVITVVVAYLMTDIKVGSRTIKGHIDHHIQFGSGLTIKEKAKSWIVKYLSKAPKIERVSKTQENEEELGEISSRDEEKLKKVIQKSQ